MLPLVLVPRRSLWRPRSISISSALSSLAHIFSISFFHLTLICFLLSAKGTNASLPLKDFVHPDSVFARRLGSSGGGSGSEASLLTKRGNGVQFSPPVANGGSQMTFIDGTDPAGLGEPINLIISATSDPRVLKNQMDNGGLLNYFQSIGFNGECLGQHIGGHQQADLGDGHGRLNETAVMRWNYGDPQLGTCKESFVGGNHFRYWIQDGSKANTGAVFLAVSYEKPANTGHDIIFNGYNLARDELIGNATALGSAPPTGTYQLVPANSTTQTNSTSNSTSSATPLPTPSTTIESFTFSPTGTSTQAPPLPTLASSITSSTNPQVSIADGLPIFVGQTSAGNFTYRTTAMYLTGLLSNTSQGVNHFATVGNQQDGMNAIDGIVGLLVVEVISSPKGSSGAMSLASPSPLILSTLLVFALSLQVLSS